VAAGLALVITRSNSFERRPAVPQIHD